MNAWSRLVFVGGALIGMIGFLDSPSSSYARGCRTRTLLPGRLVIRGRGVPMIVEPCVPIAAEPVKEPELPPVSNDLRTNIKNIADLIKLGKPAAATKLAKAAAVHIEDLTDLMTLYRPRNKGGLGWGSNPLTTPARDGVEAGLRVFVAGGAPKKGFAQREVNEEVGYTIAAMAELTMAKAPQGSRVPDKRKHAWTGAVKNLREGSDEWIKASIANQPLEMQKAAAKIHMACTSCHSVFKE